MNVLSRIEGWLLLGALSCYFVSMLLLWVQLFFRSNEPAEHRPWQPMMVLGTRILLWSGAGLHLLALFGQGGALWKEQAGVSGLFGWALVVAYLLFHGRLNQMTTGPFITPVALLATLYSLTAPTLHRFTPAPERLESQWLVIHVILILMGFVALAFAFSASLLYLIQEGLLKRKQLTGLFQRLPSLQTADDVIYRSTCFGLALLTMGLITGVVWWQRHQPNYAVWQDPKVVFSLLTWLTFAAYIAARLWLGWRGRRTNLVVVYGFVLMVISFLGMPHVIQESKAGTQERFVPIESTPPQP
jgi:ABC-type uncharacterized transport system permease subunit